MQQGRQQSGQQTARKAAASYQGAAGRRRQRTAEAVRERAAQQLRRHVAPQEGRLHDALPREPRGAQAAGCAEEARGRELCWARACDSPAAHRPAPGRRRARLQSGRPAKLLGNGHNGDAQADAVQVAQQQRQRGRRDDGEQRAACGQPLWAVRPRAAHRRGRKGAPALLSSSSQSRACVPAALALRRAATASCRRVAQGTRGAQPARAPGRRAPAAPAQGWRAAPPPLHGRSDQQAAHRLPV